MLLKWALLLRLAIVNTSSLTSMMELLSVVIVEVSLTNAGKRQILVLVQSQQLSETDDADVGAPAAVADGLFRKCRQPATSGVCAVSVEF